MQNPALDIRPDPGSIPDAPGCYQFKDARGRVLYVGKAKSLRARLANYFQAVGNIQPRTRAMLEAARSVDWIVVDTEVEALHLEYTLIQRHRPRYNVRYRDDKSYPYLVITTSEEVPRARVARGAIAKDDRRFGPYAHAYAIRETLDLLLRVFPVRTCSKGVFDRAVRTDRPCLLHHIDRCAAPCTGVVSHDEHRELVNRMAAFLDGETTEVVNRLEAGMRAASAELNFEAAARLRDQLTAARRALEKQQMVTASKEDFDAIAIHEDELEASIQAFFVRRGRLVGRKGWTVDKVEPLTPAQLLTSFMLRLYAERDDEIPPQIVVPVLPDDQEALAVLLAEQRGRSRAGGRGRPSKAIGFVVPQRGDKRRFLATVEENAKEAFQRTRLRRASDFDARTKALKELQEALNLEEAPLRIECFDVSHLSGTEVVASMVVFEDGLPRKSEYRRFKLSVDTNDDFAAMREVIWRRFRRLADERAAPVADDEVPGHPRVPAVHTVTSPADGAHEILADGVVAGDRAGQQQGERTRTGAFTYPPNLVIVDGGVGQLHAALEGVADLPIDDAAFVAIAKRFEELWLPGAAQPVVLPRGSEALFLVQRVRDEAHRFAIAYQRTRRTRSVTSSQLDDVPGIGPVRRKALLARFGSVAAIRRASIEELAAVPGVSSTLATNLKVHLAGS